MDPRRPNLQAIELEEARGRSIRPLMQAMLDQPLSVRLVSIDNVAIPCPAGVDHLLDAFYVELLGMVRLPNTEIDGFPVIRFKADNAELQLIVEDRPVDHDAMRPLLVEIDDRATLTKKLIDRQVHYELVKGISAGDDHLLLVDPAGNYVGVIHHVRV